jgi:hypothetical protein
LASKNVPTRVKKERLVLWLVKAKSHVLVNALDLGAALAMRVLGEVTHYAVAKQDQMLVLSTR